MRNGTMDLFGGRKVSPEESRRIDQVQALIREFAGTVDESTDELAKIKAAMKAKAAVAVMESPPVEPVPPTPAPPPARPTPAAEEMHTFCTQCGSRLPSDGSGCENCKRNAIRRCPGCGSFIPINLRSCPVCGRVLPMIRT
jgi:hypothetical protein